MMPPLSVSAFPLSHVLPPAAYLKVFKIIAGTNLEMSFPLVYSSFTADEEMLSSSARK